MLSRVSFLNYILSAKIMYRSSGLLLGCLVLTGCLHWFQPELEDDIGELRPGKFTLDVDHSSLIFKVEHLGFSDYVGRFNQLEAELDFDGATPLNTRLSAKVLVASLDLVDDDLEALILGVNWLASKRYATAVFQSTGAKWGGDGRLKLSGLLTLHGITKPLDIDVDIRAGGFNLYSQKYTLGFQATTEIRRSEFGITRYLEVVGDKVKLEVNGEFIRRGAID